MDVIIVKLKEKCDCVLVGTVGHRCYHNDPCKVVRQFWNGRYLIEDSKGMVRAVDVDEVVEVERY